MPSYKVLKKGFHGGRIYDPDGKRKVLHAEKPFPNKPKSKVEDVPSWLEAIKSETPAQTSAGKGAETKAFTAAKKKAVNAAKKKAESDKKDIADASFMGDGETANTDSNVETL